MSDKVKIYEVLIPYDFTGSLLVEFKYNFEGEIDELQNYIFTCEDETGKILVKTSNFFEQKRGTSCFLIPQRFFRQDTSVNIYLYSENFSRDLLMLLFKISNIRLSFYWKGTDGNQYFAPVNDIENLRNIMLNLFPNF